MGIFPFNNKDREFATEVYNKVIRIMDMATLYQKGIINAEQSMSIIINILTDGIV